MMDGRVLLVAGLLATSGSFGNDPNNFFPGTTSLYSSSERPTTTTRSPSHTTGDDVRPANDLIFSLFGLTDVFKKLEVKLFPRPHNVSQSCYSDGMTFLQALAGINNEGGNTSYKSMDWAVRALDSSGKPNSGLLSGGVQFVGKYDQCLSTHAHVPAGTHLAGDVTTQEISFGMRYCRLQASVDEMKHGVFTDDFNPYWSGKKGPPLYLNWGICLPQSCSSSDIMAALDFYSQYMPLTVNAAVCDDQIELSGDVGALLVTLTLSVIAAVVLVCTVLDVLVEQSHALKLFTLEVIGFKFRNESEKSADGKEKCEEKCEENLAYCGIELDTVLADSGAQENDVATLTVPGETDTSGDVTEDQQPTDGGELILTESQIDAEVQDGNNTSGDHINNTVGDHGNSNKAAEDLSNNTSEEHSNNTAEEHSNNTSGDYGNTTGGEYITIELDSKDNNGESTTCDDAPTVNGTADLVHTESGGVKVDLPTPDPGDAVKPDTPEKSQGQTSASTLWSVVKAFSVYSNFRKLMSSATGSYTCIYGIRVVSMAWIILGHGYTYGAILDETNTLFENPKFLPNHIGAPAFSLVGSANLAVDTFFVLSAFLLMQNCLREYKSIQDKTWRTKLPFWALFYIKRFWRLTPVYAVVLFSGMFLYDQVVEGPLKAEKFEEFYDCRDKWWSHLLYVNNFYQPEKKCMTWSWYLAVDTQLYMAAPFFIMQVARNRKVGLIVISVAMVGSMVAAAIAEALVGGTFIMMDISFVDYWQHVYSKPWTRGASYCLGLIMGVLMSEPQYIPDVSKRVSLVIWPTSIMVGLLLVFLPHDQWSPTSQHWSSAGQAVYEAVSRPVWALCVAWVIYACSTGRGGIVNKVLSLSAFTSLSRLVYCMYLIHPVIITFVTYSRRATIYMDPSHLTLIYNYIGNLVLTLLFAVALTLVVESPMMSLEKILLRRRRR